MSLLGFGVCHTIPDLKYALARCSTSQSSKTVGQTCKYPKEELIEQILISPPNIVTSVYLILGLVKLSFIYLIPLPPTKLRKYWKS
jgi:hypothetical protein